MATRKTAKTSKASERKKDAKEGAMPNFQALQYRGDAADMQTLYEKFKVGTLLQSGRECDKQSERSLRASLSRSGVRLTDTISPRTCGIVRTVQQNIGFEGEVALFSLRDTDINAFAALDISESGEEYVIGATSAALESLNDDELAFVLGHEFGHVIYRHNDLLGLKNNDPNDPRLTILPYLGEHLYLGWRKKGEISADRIGLLGCGSFEASARALIKTAYGLSERNLNLDVDGLLAQIESLKGRPEAMDSAFGSHPDLPVRLKALKLFEECLLSEGRIGLEEVENHIDTMFAWAKRYPAKKLDEAVMHAVACAGLDMLVVDEEIVDKEIETLVLILHKVFTDDPESELLTDSEERGIRLKKAIATINKEGEELHKRFIISRLVQLALMDGLFLNDEKSIIMDIALKLKLDPKVAHAIIIEVARDLGLGADVQTKGIAQNIKDKFFKPLVK